MRGCLSQRCEPKVCGQMRTFSSKPAAAIRYTPQGAAKKKQSNGSNRLAYVIKSKANEASLSHRHPRDRAVRDRDAGLAGSHRTRCARSDAAQHESDRRI